MNLRKVLEKQISELEKKDIFTIDDAVNKADMICKIVKTISELPKEAPEVEAQELEINAKAVADTIEKQLINIRNSASCDKA